MCIDSKVLVRFYTTRNVRKLFDFHVVDVLFEKTPPQFASNIMYMGARDSQFI